MKKFFVNLGKLFAIPFIYTGTVLLNVFTYIIDLFKWLWLVWLFIVDYKNTTGTYFNSKKK